MNKIIRKFSPWEFLFLKPIFWGFMLAALFSCGPKEGAESSEKSYNPRVSPLPERTPKQEWGIDNGETIISHTFSVFSDPMYPSDFAHFDYANPDAPQGGTLRLAIFGTFDSFNPYARRGDNAAYIGDGYVYDTLMAESSDEIDALYPLIAERIEYAKDFSYVIFHIDPRARFQDGKPITAEAVAFTFTKFMTQGVAQFAAYFADVSVRAISELKVRFDLPRPSRAMIAELADLTILPQQFWKDRDLAEPLQEAPPGNNMGSGGWQIADYEMGSWMLLEKRNDYWAADLPVKRGLYNFRYYRIDYYQDGVVELEAFKSGAYDFRAEGSSKNWKTQYNGPLFDSGAIIQAPFADTQPPLIQGMIFNTERALFQDYRVRRALSYALDFEWMNKNLFYGLYKRNRSYFPGTDYEAKGLPSEQELAILEPIAAQIPPEVFTKAYDPPKTDGSGQVREGIASALELLKDAGWELEDGVLQNRGEPFAFEIMLYSPSEERIMLPVQENLKKMGIAMEIKLPDSAQYIERLQSGQYDMIQFFYGPHSYPESDMNLIWHSDFLDSSYNRARVNDAAIDYLVDGIVANQQNKQALIHWGRAFDRVFQWQGYMIFQWYLPEFWVAHIDKFGKPEVWPKYGGIDAWKYWWLDEEKLAALPENLR